MKAPTGERPLLKGLLIVVTLFAACAAVVAADEPVAVPPAPALRIVPMGHGLKSIAPEGDMTRLAETIEYNEAQKVGLDLGAPGHDACIHRFTGERLFSIGGRAPAPVGPPG